jgi:subtilisin family serine protease
MQEAVKVQVKADNLSQPQPQPLRNVVPNQLIIGYQPGGEQAARALVASEGGTVLRTSRTGGNFLVAEFPTFLPRSPVPGLSAGAAIRQALRACQTCNLASPLRYAEPVVIYHACFEPNDPMYAANQWDKWVMYSDHAWDITQGSRSVKVGIVDEGIDYKHPDLAADFDSTLKGYDFVDNDSDPYPKNTMEDHASHVAGIVAAGLNNGVGVAGWANVRLYSVRVLNDSGSGTTDVVADGIRWAAQEGCRIINLSLGGTSGTQSLQDAVNYAWGLNALVIGAAGNDGQESLYYPGAYGNALSVAALDTVGVAAYFSNYGPQMGVIAPGVDILSTVPFGQYALMDGTSMATPEVSGVAALVLSYDSSLSAGGLRSVLEASAIDMGAPGWDEHYGYGLVNAWRALQLADMFTTSENAEGATWNLGPEARSPSIIVAAGALDVSRLGGMPVKVYDTRGRCVLRLDRSSIRSGQVPIHLASGVYFAAAEGSFARPTKLVVIR